MPLAVNITVDIVQVGAGNAPGLLGQNQANQPGYGQSQLAGIIGNAQTFRILDAEQVPGTAGSTTLANIKTALDAAAVTIAGASGTPLITAAKLAEINSWNSGAP